MSTIQFLRDHPDALRSLLDEHGGRNQAARAVGVRPRTLRSVCDRLGVKSPRKRRPPVRGAAERDALVGQWLPMVKAVMRRLAHLPSVRRHWHECYSAGMGALLRAAELWEERKGCAFQSFAWWRVYYRVLERAARRRRERLRSYEGFRGRRFDPRDRGPGPAEEAQRAEAAARAARLVRRGLGRLTERQAQALRLRYGLGGAAEHTLEELAAATGGHCKHAAWRLVGRALARLRRELLALGYGDRRTNTFARRADS